jgi:hypothetical protein
MELNEAPVYAPCGFDCKFAEMVSRGEDDRWLWCTNPKVGGVVLVGKERSCFQTLLEEQPARN